jgi:hypothetical protein
MNPDGVAAFSREPRTRRALSQTRIRIHAVSARLDFFGQYLGNRLLKIRNGFFLLFYAILFARGRDQFARKISRERDRIMVGKNAVVSRVEYFNGNLDIRHHEFPRPDVYDVFGHVESNYINGNPPIYIILAGRDASH